MGGVGGVFWVSVELYWFLFWLEFEDGQSRYKEGGHRVI